MPNTKPVNDCAQVTELILRRAKEANLCRIYPAGAISKGLLGEEMAEMGELVATGCVCVTDDGRPVMNAGLLRRVLQYAQQFRIPVMLHEEDLSLSARGAMNEGHWSFRLGLPPIPASAEVSMVARDIVLAEETGGRMHIAHVSCEGSVRLLREAKRRGLAVTAEATPHHFSLNEERVGEYQTNAKMNPPLRNQRDVDAIREALVDGTVDAIATDHAPHGPLDKDVEFEKAMNGVVGLETAVGLTLELVHAGVLSPRRAVELLSSGPAGAFGLPAGQLRQGAAADIAVIDPTRQWTVEPSQFYSKSRNTPFGGRALKGAVTHTLVGGRVLYQNGKVVEADT
jgi:dihydroorotase